MDWPRRERRPERSPRRRGGARGVFASPCLWAVLVAIGAGASASIAAAQSGEEANAAAAPIVKQLEAFRRGDYDAAYAFASADIRQMFGRPEFERMVKSGYPEIAQSVFALVSGSEAGPDGHLYVRVKVRGANGNSVEALYDMVREPDGWRINGVVTRPDPGLVLFPLPTSERAG
jgi:Domain of unknown function (DUF4864)